jgi:hypothetical protein
VSALFLSSDLFKTPSIEQNVLQRAYSSHGWEVVREVESASSASELLKQFDRRLTGAGGAAAGTNAGAWDFSGEEGSAWVGRASLSPAPRAAGKFTLSLRIERAPRA